MTAISSSYLLNRMGSETTEAEAAAMVRVLAARGIDTEAQVDAMTDEEFFALIPAAVASAAASKLGSIKSAAKAKSSAANGAKGGRPKLPRIDWSDDDYEARVSISDGVTTIYATEDDIPGDEIDFVLLAKSYARTYDHNGNDDGYVVADIEDLDQGKSWKFAFDGRGNFEWNTRRN